MIVWYGLTERCEDGRRDQRLGQIALLLLLHREVLREGGKVLGPIAGPV
jgi:hypothetical protein